MRKTRLLIATAVALTLAGCGNVNQGTGAPGQSGTTAPKADGAYVNVVKLTGIAWFNRMNTGVEAFAKSSGQSASQTGPSTDSPEQQVGIIQGLIAQKPKALAVVPSDPGAVDAVLKEAKKSGIVVVTHEAPALTGVDADIEAFDNPSYGQRIMGDMAGCMKQQGEYVQFVGKLTAETHMAWSKAGYDKQQAEYPGMKRISEPVESNDNADTAYQKTKQLLQANPKLVGFQGASSQDVPGIARAIEEAGLQGQTCVYGTGVPSETKKYVNSGAIDGIYLWDPALAGEAMLKTAKLIVDGKTITAGTDLGVKGYNNLKVSPTNPKVFFGDAQLALTKDNIDQYDF